MGRLSGYDLVVIGAGVVGASAALFAARLGARVALVEKGLPGQEGSGRNGGGVRQQGRLPAEQPLAMHSIKLWQWLRDELGGRFEYVQKGNLFLALSETESEILRVAAVWQQQIGLPVSYLEPAQIREVAPSLSDRILGATYCPTDGQANPILATRFILLKALEAGVTLLSRTQVTGLEARGGKISTVRTDRGDLDCGAVIVAAGAWGTDLLRTLDLHIPVIARRTQILVTTPMRRVLEQFVSGNTIYIRQAQAGNLLIGGGGNWEERGYGRTTTYPSVHRFVARAKDILPVVSETSVLRTWAGTLDISPDGVSLVGALREVGGLVLAAGFGGHGFALGPGAGDVTARLALGMEPDVDITGLDPARFSPGMEVGSWFKPVAEPAP